MKAHASDDRLPTKFVGDWCLAEHTADHLTFYRRGRCANPDQDEWLTIRSDSFDVHEMHCMLLGARANKRGDYLAKFRCDNLIQNYWFSLLRIASTYPRRTENRDEYSGRRLLACLCYRLWNCSSFPFSRSAIAPFLGAI
jgi:hypothetical protein